MSLTAFVAHPVFIPSKALSTKIHIRTKLTDKPMSSDAGLVIAEIAGRVMCYVVSIQGCTLLEYFQRRWYVIKIDEAAT
jgi:hypothetical protein